MNLAARSKNGQGGKCIQQVLYTSNMFILPCQSAGGFLAHQISQDIIAANVVG
jgi:hypothetical protein